jgi:hypothetical protein
MIPTTTNSGLHELVGNNVVSEFVCPGLKITAFFGESILGDAQIIAIEAAR